MTVRLLTQTLPLIFSLLIATDARAQDRLAGALAGWRSDLPGAIEAAARAKKPLMVVFRCVP